ncbi:MAG: hypothetical protein SGJ19_23925 [Planctomycetia bacterium]|nr:hypothetical protein [Planctomycetia bacterium]
MLLLLALITGCGAETDPERIAARWVLDSGGQLQVDADGKATTISAETGLPAGALNVVGVAWDIYPGDRNPRVTDAELVHFASFPKLKSLDIWASDVTDAGMAQLTKLPALEQLILTDTKITDAGLAQIEQIKTLQELSLIDTQVTKAGVAKLKRALPNCRVRN